MSGTTIAHAASHRGEVVLRTRDDGALELRVNGVFVMDSAESTTESALADLALARIRTTRSLDPADRPPVTVLIGGLGLGYTLRRLADDPFVDEIQVAEIEPALLAWHRAALLPATLALIGSPRVLLTEGDVREVIRAAADATLDAVILDVDNGPGFLVYDDNAAVYQAEFLAACHRVLREGGCVVVWSADEAPDLEVTLSGLFQTVEHRRTPVTLGLRADCYHAYVATKTRPPEQPCRAR